MKPLLETIYHGLKPIFWGTNQTPALKCRAKHTLAFVFRNLNAFYV